MAIVLVCLSSVSPDACDEASAVEVRSTRVANEMGRVTGADAAGEIGRTTYLKTVCRRLPARRQD